MSNSQTNIVHLNYDKIEFNRLESVDGKELARLKFIKHQNVFLLLYGAIKELNIWPLVIGVYLIYGVHMASTFLPKSSCIFELYYNKR